MILRRVIEHVKADAPATSAGLGGKRRWRVKTRPTKGLISTRLS
jgi:hypothetical protein